jgi:hypothetical protein
MARTWQEHGSMVVVGVGAEEQGKNQEHGNNTATSWQ